MIVQLSGLGAGSGPYKTRNYGFSINPVDDLFSHSVTKAVSSALGRFTTVFGMGTGGSTPLEPPGNLGGQYAPFFTNWQGAKALI